MMCKGSIVKSLSGHDSGLVFMVMEEESEGYVIIANGRQRPVEKPKRKNVKHVTLLDITEFGNPTNKQLKRILSAYINL